MITYSLQDNVLRCVALGNSLVDKFEICLSVNPEDYEYEKNVIKRVVSFINQYVDDDSKIFCLQYDLSKYWKDEPSNISVINSSENDIAVVKSMLICDKPGLNKATVTLYCKNTRYNVVVFKILAYTVLQLAISFILNKEDSKISDLIPSISMLKFKHYIRCNF